MVGFGSFSLKSEGSYSEGPFPIKTLPTSFIEVVVLVNKRGLSKSQIMVVVFTLILFVSQLSNHVYRRKIL